MLTYDVLAHVGHDHSRDKSVDEAADQTEVEATNEQDASEAEETVQDAVQGTGQETQAVVSESGLFERFSVGVGESVFALLLVLPFLLKRLKRRGQSK